MNSTQKASWLRALALIGIALIAVGVLVIILLACFPQIETLNQQSVDLTTKDSFWSNKFNAERGNWLDLDIVSDSAGAVHVNGQIVGEIFNVEGTTYEYRVNISQDDVYQVQVENKKGHYEFIFIWPPDENHITGNLY